MTRMMKELIAAFLCAMFALMLITPISGNRINAMSLLIRNQCCAEQAERKELEKAEAEKIHTYYINVGGHTTNVCGDYTDYPSYSFNTETGEWSDGGEYVIHINYLCKINRYGEWTKVGIILAIEHGDRLFANYMH